MESTASCSSLEFWKKETLALQLLFFFFFSKMKRKRVLKSSRDVMFRICGCLVNLANSFEMKLMGCLSTAAHHSFRKTTFGILAYQRDVQTFCEKGKPDNRSYSCSRPHIKIFQDSFFLSHLSYASNEFGLYHHTVIFSLVKCCFLSRLHQVVRSSLHCIASSLQTHHLKVSMHGIHLYTVAMGEFKKKTSFCVTCSLLMASESWSAFTLQATSSWAVEAATCLAEEMSFSSLAWPCTEALAASHRLLVAAATIRAYSKQHMVLMGLHFLLIPANSLNSD